MYTRLYQFCLYKTPVNNIYYTSNITLLVGYNNVLSISLCVVYNSIKNQFTNLGHGWSSKTILTTHYQEKDVHQNPRIPFARGALNVFRLFRKNGGDRLPSLGCRHPRIRALFEGGATSIWSKQINLNNNMRIRYKLRNNGFIAWKYIHHIITYVLF